MQKIKNNIKKYRLQNKITQEQLAELLNVSVSLISNIESKKVNKGIKNPKIKLSW